MATWRVVEDPVGIAEILRSPEMSAAVLEAAESIASNITQLGLSASSGAGAAKGLDGEISREIEGFVGDYVTTKRGRIVGIRHPAGDAMQAKHGALTRAAAAAGFEVMAP